MATCAQMTAWLADAEITLNALHQGKSVVLLADGEKKLQYSPAQVATLEKYILTLQRKVDACNGVNRAGRLLSIIPVDSNSDCY